MTLKVDNISFGYTSKEVLKNISFSANKGDYIAVIGESGCGKSTLLEIIYGLLHIEKGGVNFSAVEGNLPEKISKALKIDTGEFYATGVSIVLHPKNPHVPIIHMNVRYFEMSDGRWWFGGGIDVTPHYVVEEDAKFFHQYLKTICDEHHESYYPEFKKWADDYFYIKHRDETRGIGGIFFDRLSKQNGFEKRERFDFVKSVGNAFCPIYLNLLHKNNNHRVDKQFIFCSKLFSRG